MFSKKKKEARKGGGGKGKALMEQMGMFPDMLGGNMDLDEDDDDDGDLEAELLALAGNTSPSKPKAKPAKGLNAKEFDKMVAASLKDYRSDEDLSDAEDPDLMAELEELTTQAEPSPVSTPVPPPASAAPASGECNQMALIEERLETYASAEASAKASGESSKARRMNRGVKTLQDLLKKSKSGKPVNEDDIPPPVTSGSSKSSSEKTTPENEQPPAPKPQESAAVFVAVRPTELEPPRPAVKPTSPRSGPPQTAPKPSSPRLGAPEATVKPPSPQAKALVPEVRPSQTAVHAASMDVTVERSEPELPKADSSEAEKLKLLAFRRDQFKSAALEAKQANDTATAVRHIKTAKQFERVIEALQQGQPVDLSQMPPPPGVSPATMTKVLPDVAPPAVVRSAMQASHDHSPEEEVEIPRLSQQETQKLFNAPGSAETPLEALQQRLAKYKSSQAEAQQEGNASKAKRMGRITKQYDDTIKMFKAGRPVDFEELPCPPGFPPIPGLSKTPAGTPTQPPTSVPEAAQPAVRKAAAPAAPEPARPAPSQQPQQPAVQRPKINRQLSAMSRSEQQTIFLQERQLQFRKAALQAKRNDDMELAKKYLRFAKGLDQMITASTSGLPVDMSQVPPAPNSGQEEKFEFVDSEQVTGDRDTMYKKLEQELIQQMKTCSANADSFTHLGDVASATKFDRMRQNCMKDIDTLRNAFKHGDPVPRFHYENRQFSMVKCCTDLGDNDLEINIIKGMNYGLPSGYAAKDMDTYVKYEFPYPTDNPQTGTTDTCKHTNMPEYDQAIKLQINRKSRSFLRLLKSNKHLKLEVYYKRGFLKGDKALGSVQTKLQPLENECVIHECVDLMDGRKASGGKLEYKVRVRDPFISKQVEEMRERWLVIDKFERTVKPQPQAMAPAQKPASASRKAYPAPEKPMQRSNDARYTSIEVLKYEKQLLEQQIRKYEGRLNKSEEDTMRHKLDLLQNQIDETRQRLQAGGAAAYKAYVSSIEQTQANYLQEAKVWMQQGNREKAQLLMTKKKYIEREVELIKSKLNI